MLRKWFRVGRKCLDRKNYLSSMIDPKIDTLAQSVLQRDRASLSKAITLVESQTMAHQLQARDLFASIRRQSGGSVGSKNGGDRFRVGITGPPGAGKSTFIASLGMHLLQEGHRVAVLAIDPSSTRTGGSLLGDKTRMHDLSLQDNAYIRPSPSGGLLGGIAHATSESASLCEAAGFDITIVETVGVGQSETAVADMVDMVVLLVPPAAGDEIQGMKKGIVELADLLVVNKFDGDLKSKARHTKVEYMHALSLLRPKYSFWNPKVVLCSSLPPIMNQGVDPTVTNVWEEVCSFKQCLLQNGVIDTMRQRQREQMMWKELQYQFLDIIQDSDSSIANELRQVQQAISKGDLAPRHAAKQILDLIIKK